MPSFLCMLLAALFVLAGVLHFVAPKPYVRMVPDYLPAHLALVYISGAFEILGGLLLLLPATRSFAAWGLIALLIAVFPANVHMALHHIGIGAKPPPQWMLWARLPLQLVMIAWAYKFTA